MSMRRFWVSFLEMDEESELHSALEFMEVYGGCDDQQQMAVSLALDGTKNVAVLGVAGSGKSYVIDAIRKGRQLELSKKSKTARVVLSATTSMAATLLEAENVFKILGFVMKYDAKKREAYASVNWRGWSEGVMFRRYSHISTLIIDEASMLSAVMLEEMDQLFKRVRQRCDLPFGGVQVILVGDFHQLPPVDEFPSHNLRYGKEKQYLFLSDLWETAFGGSVVHLTNQHRQVGDDPTLRDLLGVIRTGRITAAAKALIETRVRAVPPVRAVIVCPMVHQADEYNKTYLDGMGGELERFEGKLWLQADPKKPLELEAVVFGERGAPKGIAELRSMGFLVPFVNQLKQGCRVLVTAAIDIDLHNGAQGIYMGMDEATKSMRVLLDRTQQIHLVRLYKWRVQQSRDGPSFIYENFPVIVGYAITIHKCQGMTLDEVFVEGGSFDAGQAYVACSRVRTIEGLFFSAGFHASDVKVSERVEEFYGTIGSLNM